jgi:hypothetical protein
MTRPKSRLHVLPLSCPNHTPAKTETSLPVSAARKANTLGVLWSGFKFLVGGREKNFTINRVEAQELARHKLADLLRAPFPNMSDRAIAAEWAPRLQRSTRQVENWLKSESCASFSDAYAIAAIHGLFPSIAILVGEDTRSDTLKRIGQKT